MPVRTVRTSTVRESFR